MILSVSQVESFDPKQKGGCPRRWWFDRVQGLRPDQDTAQKSGDDGHRLLADYFRTGEVPKGRVKMGKAVRGAVLREFLPKPEAGMLIEWRFSGQPKLDDKGEWVKLDESKTLHLGGVPWEGFIDLAFRRDGEIPEVWDHKFSSDIHAYSKKASELIHTVQMPVYVLALQRLWPDAEDWSINHHYIARTGVESFPRGTVVHIDEVLERAVDIEEQVRQIQITATITDQNDVAFNRKSCHTWLGCPHQSLCKAFREKQVSLTQEEQDLFAGIDEAPPPAAAKPNGATPPADDDEAALEAKLIALKREKAAKVKATIEAAKAAEAAKSTPVPVVTQTDTTLPAPAKKPKRMIEDQSTSPDSVPCDPKLIQGATYRLPDGTLGVFNCSTDGRYSFTMPEGAPRLLDPGTRVVPVEKQTMIPLGAAIVELGPQTRALLTALIAKLK